MTTQFDNDQPHSPIKQIYDILESETVVKTAGDQDDRSPPPERHRYERWPSSRLICLRTNPWPSTLPTWFFFVSMAMAGESTFRAKHRVIAETVECQTVGTSALPDTASPARPAVQIRGGDHTTTNIIRLHRGSPGCCGDSSGAGP